MILGDQVVGRSYRLLWNLGLIDGVAGHHRTINGLIVSTRPCAVPLGHARCQILGTVLLDRDRLNAIRQRLALLIQHWLTILVDVVNRLGDLLGPLVVNKVVNQVNEVVIPFQLVGHCLTLVACHTWIQNVRRLVALRILIKKGLVALALVAKDNRGLVVTRHCQFCQRLVSRSRVVDKGQGRRLGIRGVNVGHVRRVRRVDPVGVGRCYLQVVAFDLLGARLVAVTKKPWDLIVLSQRCPIHRLVVDRHRFFIWGVNVGHVRRVRRVDPVGVSWRCRQVVALDLLGARRVIIAVAARLRFARL